MEFVDAIGKLRKWFEEFSRIAVMVSGGLDSLTLLTLAVNFLGRKSVTAITITSELHPPWDFADAVKYAQALSIRHIILDGSFILHNPKFRKNNTDRCYVCKKLMLLKSLEVARAEGVDIVVDGSNADDLRDFRPGLRALEEFRHLVRSPFMELGIGKECIREIARSMGLGIYLKPPSPCFATRIPYGREITVDLIRRVRAGEEFLRSLGFSIVRIRDLGSIARIEVSSREFDRVLRHRDVIVKKLKSLGYEHVVLDLEPYGKHRLGV